MKCKVWVLSSSKETGDRLAARLKDAGIESRIFSSNDALTSEAGNSGPVVVLVESTGGDDSSWKEISNSLNRLWGTNGYPILAVKNPDPETLVEAMDLGYRGVVLLKDDAKELGAQLERQVQRGLKILGRSAAVLELRDIVDTFVSEIARISKLEQHPSEEGPQHVEKVKVLVVDSDTTGQGEPIFRELCNHQSMSAHKVSTAAEALAITKGEPYDIFIVDNELSDYNAIDLIKELSEECPGAESIYVVGFTAADSAVDALRWGAASFLLKPFSAEDMIAHVEESIKRVTGRKKTRNALRDFDVTFKQAWEKTQ